MKLLSMASTAALLLASHTSFATDHDIGIKSTCEARTCVFEIPIVEGRAVSWYITSQTAGNPGIEIVSPEGDLIAKTTVYSRELNNKSIGDFIAPSTGRYTVIFSNMNEVLTDTATITNDWGTTVSQTFQFAGEDSSDYDYNDIFAVITWFDKKG
ncbi:hypothetical protein [Shewanella surugensis]|uniref:DUF4198 domain-containing protein n=1 Tax=Shewanella surugensis TaxID=212020 RepID=A0ABT0LBA0_9GAMM|nr:hypothetical protein [Shewanella surugensis]MCL1124854.1 hypothetical protein [Shewanella surugensis]